MGINVILLVNPDPIRPTMWMGSKVTMTITPKDLVSGPGKTITTGGLPAAYTVDLYQKGGKQPVRVVGGLEGQPDKLSGKGLDFLGSKKMETTEAAAGPLKLEFIVPDGSFDIEAHVKDVTGQTVATCPSSGKGIREVQSGGGCFGWF